MLDTQSQNSELQGGNQTVNPSTQVPQQPGGENLQQPLSSDVLSQPSAQISLPTPSQNQSVQEINSSGGNTANISVNSVVLVGAFTLALVLVLLLAKFAQPVAHHDSEDQQAQAPTPQQDVIQNNDAQRTKRKNKKKSRRQRRKNT